MNLTGDMETKDDAEAGSSLVNPTRYVRLIISDAGVDSPKF
jgi:hypothetical protein